jgi:hypothetical protein
VSGYRTTGYKERFCGESQKAKNSNINVGIVPYALERVALVLKGNAIMKANFYVCQKSV